MHGAACACTFMTCLQVISAWVWVGAFQQLVHVPWTRQKQQLSFLASPDPYTLWPCRYKFIAHPAGFLVHRQHSRSHADKMYQAQKKDYERDVKLNKITKSRPNNNLAGLTHRFRDKVQEDLAAGTYEPLIDEGIKKCVRELPWWDKARAADIKRAQLLRQRQRRRYLLEAAGSFGAEQQQQQQQHQGQPWSWVQWLQQQWQQLAPGLPAL